MTKSASVALLQAHNLPKPVPRRRGRIAKLPKMNNSERGKYYRHKNKQHELGLEHSVATLRKQVRDLELFLRVRDELIYRNPYDACDSIASTIYDYFVRARDGHGHFDASFAQSESSQRPMWTSTASFEPAKVPAFAPSAMGTTPSSPWQDPNAFLFFDLLSFDVEGGVDAPVVVMRGMLHAKYTLATIDRMFPHLMHYQDLLDMLLDKDVRYPCTYHFYFGANGEFHNKIVEADYVHGLQQVIGSLDDVMWLLNGSHRYAERRDSLDDMVRGPSPMSLNFILS